MKKTLADQKLSASETHRTRTLAKNLRTWADSNLRDFPWRAPTSGTFERITCEVLLQRTRAENVAAIYQDFFTRFPSWEKLHQAGKAEIEQIIKPLGIWRRRAISLKSLAGKMVELGGKYPEERNQIEALPAVGQYVANAIELFDKGYPRPLLDTNMARVLERYFKPRILSDIRYDPWLQLLSQTIVSRQDPILVNWAILDIGATVCKPKNPRCEVCPIKRGCNWFKNT